MFQAEMDVTFLRPDDSAYPAAIAEASGVPPPIAAHGNLDLLHSRPLALFCSIKCPGDIILGTYDLIRALRDAGVPMIGGFHSPMEKECLRLLLRGTQPVVICPARSLDSMRVPTAWKGPLAAGRLLILSPFKKNQRHMTAEMARTRNAFVAALADQILVAHAEPGGKLEAFFLQLLSCNKHLWTLASNENKHLVGSGARELTSECVREVASIGARQVR
jgi:predicted Rossmann fold nucleotide-binding protein DprA/Smf involved in DNA uptake